ncbi:hypothetical protein [Stenotrophomonas lacuserhaii]|uniref:hypothetical protein n=1 Tax=Stenotrophomonas lacuserhaii TaxID=2760084 RepID=UPI0032EBE0D9
MQQRPPARPALTAAAWNRHGRQRRPRLTHWLRALPHPARSSTLVYLFGAVFFAVPGSVLVFAQPTQAPMLLRGVVLLFVCAFAAGYVLSTLQHAGVLLTADRWRRAVPRGIAVLMAVAGSAPLLVAWLLPWPFGMQTLAWWTAGALACLIGVPLRPTSRGLLLQTLGHALWVLGSVLVFVAVASLVSPLPH